VVIVRERGGNSVLARVRNRKPSLSLHSRSHRQGDNGSCRRSVVVGWLT
jgi:hypothetical protein